jgi:hypothetical protein
MMAPQITNGSAARFKIEAISRQVVINAQGSAHVELDAERCAHVDFDVMRLCSDPCPDIEPRLEELVWRPPRPLWFQSLVFWLQSLVFGLKFRVFKRSAPGLPPVKPATPSFTPADLGWLTWYCPRFADSLSSEDRKTTLTVDISVPPDVPPGEYAFRVALVEGRKRTVARSQPVFIQVRSPFRIEAEPRRFTLIGNRKKDCRFTVSSTGETPLEGRAHLSAHRPETPRRLFSPPARDLDVAWLSIDGQAEQPFEKGETQTYQVKLVVPGKEPPGVYAFRLDMAEAENPDEKFAAGPVVTFTIPAFPWALVITLAVVVLLGVGVWVLRLPHIESAVSAPVRYESTATNTVSNTITAGEKISYTLRITNTAGLLGRWPASSRQVGALVDKLAGGATFIKEKGSSEDCTGYDTGTITCKLPGDKRIGQGESYSFPLIAQIPYTETKALAHTVSLGKTGVYTAPVTRQSRLVLTWLEKPETGKQDQELTYRLKVQNAGPSQSDPVGLRFEPGLRNTSFMSMTVLPPSSGCQASNLVECRWDPLAPGDSREIAIRIMPGPAVSGEITNTVALTGAVPPSPAAEQAKPNVTKLTVNPVHGLHAALSSEKTEAVTGTLNVLTYRIGVTNTMPFTATNLLVDFRKPEGITETVELKDIALVGGSKTKTRCWVSIEPSAQSESDKTSPQPANAAGQEHWVHCAIDELRQNEALTITVQTRPRKEDVYDSYVVVKSLGFSDLASVSTLITNKEEFALRLDGSQGLTVPLTDTARTKLANNFQAKVHFYYDGSAEGRLLGIGDTRTVTDTVLVPGWSIGVQSGILTLRVSADKDHQRYRRCILGASEADSAGWYTVTMNVDEKLQLAKSELQADDQKPRDCVDGPPPSKVVTPTVASIGYNQAPLTLMIGGADGSGRKNYRGAVVSVELDEVVADGKGGTPKIGQLGQWKFDKKLQARITDSSEYNQTFELPSGEWAWAPVQAPVLMPLHIQSDSTWKASYPIGGNWLSSGYQDGSWLYAWDIPWVPGWATVPDEATDFSKETRWIWAPQPYWQNACPATGTVFLRKAVELRGNPAEGKANAAVAVDDFFRLYTNEEFQGSCNSGNCYYQVNSHHLTNLHKGANVIAIVAENTGGPAGVWATIDVDFYETLTVR